MASSNGGYVHNVDVQRYLAFLNDPHNAYPGASKTPNSTYTPRSVLLRYFTNGQGSIDGLLAVVLKEEENHIPTSDTVLEQYLAVFTILLSIGKAQHLNRFIERDYNDDRLPFFDRPRHFPKTESGSFFDAFFDAQWQFCPVRFAKNPVNLQIEPEQILPLKSKEKIKSNARSTIYRVELHEDYDPFGDELGTFDIDLGTNKVSSIPREGEISDAASRRCTPTISKNFKESHASHPMTKS